MPRQLDVGVVCGRGVWMNKRNMGNFRRVQWKLRTNRVNKYYGTNAWPLDVGVVRG